MRSAVARIEAAGTALAVTLMQPDGTAEVVRVDRIIVATGLRPDLEMLRELRLDLDPATESPRVLAPLIDPNLHSCGTVRPHGHRELARSEEHTSELQSLMRISSAVFCLKKTK